LFLSEDKLVGIARFEVKWSRIAGPGYMSQNFECEAVHKITLQDLLAAIRNMKDRDITCETFAKEWFIPVNFFLADKLGLNCARRPDKVMPSPYKCRHAMDMLPQENYQAFEMVYVWLEQLFYQMLEASDLTDPAGAGSAYADTDTFGAGGTSFSGAGTFGTDGAVYAGTGAGTGYTESPVQTRFGIRDSLDYLYPGQPLSEVCDLDQCIEFLSCYIHSMGLPMIDREFPDRLKERFIRFYQSDFSALEEATDEERYLYVRFVEELIAKGSKTAIAAKGYGSYEGNVVYPCDWAAARDCMLRLLDSGDNLYPANILGLLYYEGKFTGGDPQYKEAFYYFSMAAAGGVAESIMKLGDMYLMGAYVHKNAGMSAHFYEYVYNQCLTQMKAGNIGLFPEAAYRMGLIQMDHIPGMNKPREAFSFFLEAQHALEERCRKFRRSGDDQLAKDIKEALERTRYYLDYPTDQKFVILDNLILFEMLCRDGYRVNMDWIPLDKAVQTDAAFSEIYREISDRFPDAGRIYKIRSARTKRHGDRSIGRVMLNIHELSFSKLMSSVTLYAVDVREIRSVQYPGSNRVRYDSVLYDAEKNRFEFYYDDNLAGYIAGSTFFFYADLEDKRSGS